MHIFLFYNKSIIFLYMFRACCAHPQEVKLYYTASGIVAYRCDDATYCIIQFDLLMMSITVLETRRGI